MAIHCRLSLRGGRGEYKKGLLFYQKQLGKKDICKRKICNTSAINTICNSKINEKQIDLQPDQLREFSKFIRLHQLHLNKLVNL
jgi:hypothetical protein